MDASQYKDYVLFLLFVKYVSDKYADQPFAPIQIPAGASFKDMVALSARTAIIRVGKTRVSIRIGHPTSIIGFDFKWG